MKLIRTFLFFMLILLWHTPANASCQFWENDKISLTACRHNNRILIYAELLNGWHISWDNAGDAGTPVEFNWHISDKYTITKINQSIPETFIYDDILTLYGYGKSAYYLFEITPSTENNKNFSISLDLSWTACRDFCEPEKTHFDFPDNISSEEMEKYYQNAAKTFPQKTDWKFQAVNTDGILRLTIKDPQKTFDLSVRPFIFIPYDNGIFFPSAKQNISTSADKDLIFEIESQSSLLPQSGGLLIYGDQAYDLEFSDEHKFSVFSSILLMAFVAGLILNLMPCVFPVLSLKAISLAKNSRLSKGIFGGLAYLAGVLSCFLLIASFLYFLRSSGEAIGWGFQLQSKIFVIFMLILFTAIFLMMTGIIKIKGQCCAFFERLSRLNSFMTGFFAVLIATPCTGPIMGAVLGYALMQPANVYFPVFLCLGLGYALPFTLVEFFPTLIHKILPKPDKWLNKVKYIFAIPVFITCLWLLWILAYQSGRLNNQQNHWTTYSPQKVQSLIADGKAVFIDFTAKWCITCLLNERTSLEREAFLNYAKQNDIKLIKADWTNQDDAIYHALAEYKRASVPLYIYYPPKSEGKFIILPQILTQDIVMDYLNRQN